MSDDTSQVVTDPQSISTAEEPVVPETPPVVEVPPVDSSSETSVKEEETKPEPIIEEPKVEPTPEVPEPVKEVETPKPVEETKKPNEVKPSDLSTKVSTEVEEKPIEPEVKTEEQLKVEEPKKPEPPQSNLDDLRAKANKARQDRKQENLSEVEKLARGNQINNDDVREKLHVSQSTATNYLEELTKQGKLKKSGKASATTYAS